MNSSINNLTDSNAWNQALYFAKDTVLHENDTTGFLNNNSIIDFTPVLHNSDISQILTMLLLGLIFVVAAIWYFAPSLLQNSFSPIYKSPFGRLKDSGGNKTGAFTSIVLYLNFFIMVPLLGFVILNSDMVVELEIPFEWNSFYAISILLVSWFLYRYVFIALSGFVFNTYSVALQQNRFYNSVDKALGLLFLPIVLLSLYAENNLFFYLAFIIVVGLILMRWIFTLSIGIRITNFSWFHFILYLCALEIVPFMLFLKVLQSKVFEVL